MTSPTLTGPGRLAQRREMACVLGPAALSGGFILLAAGRSWLSVTAERLPPFGPLQAELTGRQLYPALTGLAVVALLSVALALVTGGVVRRLLGGLLALVGCWACWYAVNGLTHSPPGRLSQLLGDRLTQGSGLTRLHWHPVWAGLTLPAAVLLVLCGLLLVVRASRWQLGMSARYAAPAVVAESADPWRRLDRGEDPTVSDR
ncbi:MAG: Trp biosynthesis-associated membrane protein [Jatrophihabitantaceae bacterium]